MKAQIQFLQSETAQTVESTFGISSTSMPGMNFRQSRRVTKRGVDREKSTRTLVDALFISIFLLCLFLTGCSASMNGTPREGGPSPIVLVGGGTSLPGEVDAEAPPVVPVTSNDQVAGAESEKSVGQAEPPVAGTAPTYKNQLVAFSQSPEVQERVRIVTGWLIFVRQEKTAALVDASWERLQAGKVVGPLKRSQVADHPDISVSELMMWRQLLVKDEKPLSADAERRLETLAVALTTSRSPDDLLRVDNLLVVPEALAEY